MLAATLLLAGLATAETAADRITLRDGKVLLGQVVDQGPRGGVVAAVRRGWADAALPDWSKRWKAAEAPRIKQARAQRLARLDAWRPDRARRADRFDRVLDWIDAERERLRRDFEPAEAPLMLVALARGEIRKVEPASRASRTLLRQAWIAGLDDPESATPDDLRTALKRAVVPDTGPGEPPIEELLPEPVESDDRWLLRRAATEIALDDGPRFVRFENLIVPEGQPAALGDAQKAIEGVLGDLLGNRPAVDPLADKLLAVEADGKVGAVVTRLALGEPVAVESTFWVRTPHQGWRPATTERAVARTGDLATDAGAALADDPQVKSALAAIEGLGLGGIDEGAKRQAFRAGAAVQRALGEARLALEDDLKALALPIRSAIRPKPQPALPAPESPDDPPDRL